MYLTHFLNKFYENICTLQKTKCQSTGDNAMGRFIITVLHLILFKKLNKGTENFQHVLYTEKQKYISNSGHRFSNSGGGCRVRESSLRDDMNVDIT
jgi:hypothetical protein